MSSHLQILLLALFMTAPALQRGPAVSPDTLRPGARVWLHAHNCYPEKGLWTDRLDRALATRADHLAIEQDVAWAAEAQGHGRSVVSHEAKLTGNEPTLEEHFFNRVRPMMEQALKENRRETWPLLVLHLDFKTHEPAHHQAVWDLLGRHESWLTTAERVADDTRIMPFVPGPLLVLTEAGEGQVDTFHLKVPVGERLRLFGTVVPVPPTGSNSDERAAAAISATPEALLPTGATNYRRWANFSWAVVEQGGQAKAGAWTPEDERRLQSLVSRAHGLGLWIRFYTLNGHPPGEAPGWTESYNFGSLSAAEARWKAAVAAGVEFVATDQYEEFARILAARR